MDDIVVVSLLFALFCGVIAIIFSIINVFVLLKRSPGSEAMKEVAHSIKIGAEAYLERQYLYLSVFIAIVLVILGFAVSWKTALTFVLGALSSGFTGFCGMNVAVRANVRTTYAASRSLNGALRVAFMSGSVMGFAVVGLGIVTLLISYFLVDNVVDLAGFGFGASSIALFARVAGGIYTKAADVGADLVGKVEAGIPEDDPRNPGVIADCVGDNVGDIAGMGADLFESYVSSIIATVTLAEKDPDLEALPFYIAAGGIIASLVGTAMVRTKENANQNQLINSMRGGVVLSSALSLLWSLAVVFILDVSAEYFVCAVIGLVAGLIIGTAAEYATSFAYYPTQSIAKSGITGPATVIIQGLGVGYLSTFIPVVVVAGAVLATTEMRGTYGVGIAAVSMLSTLGMSLSTDAFGPIADNAGGIAEMTDAPELVRERTDALDALGNTTAATGKGFAIGSAVMTATALLTAYTKASDVTRVDLIDENVVIPNILLGGCLPFVFAALTMLSVGHAATRIIEEIRRQFRDTPGLKEGRVGVKPDYKKCVAISTESSLHQMMLPGALAVLCPIIIGMTFGPEALSGLLAGAIVTGFIQAVSMANAGGAWDNAKKYVESGKYGGKGTEVHKATVIGDTVGDPFKDTSGPSLNILIKLMGIISLVMAPVFETTEWPKTIATLCVLLLLVLIGFWRYHHLATQATIYSQASQLDLRKDVPPPASAGVINLEFTEVQTAPQRPAGDRAALTPLRTPAELISPTPKVNERIINERILEQIVQSPSVPRSPLPLRQSPLP
eukprot:GCRY01002404.1.p1 GENE.GCRY01002404.1~~GCRY01002404.1.p1  ORF type:complete len:786 (+),score=213.20 GCRY01002404.1:146-2503(+)